MPAPGGENIINRRNPNNAFYLSIGISDPNAEDIAQAREHGVSPGADIFIHGTTRSFRRGADWTEGCTAVGNCEMRQNYPMVNDGTPIRIHPWRHVENRPATP